MPQDSAPGKSFLWSRIFIFVPSGCLLSRDRNMRRLSTSFAHSMDYVLFGVSVSGTSKRRLLLALSLLVFLTPVLLPPLLPLPRPLMSPPRFQPNLGECALCLICLLFIDFSFDYFFTLLLRRNFIYAVSIALCAPAGIVQTLRHPSKACSVQNQE